MRPQHHLFSSFINLHSNKLIYTSGMETRPSSVGIRKAANGVEIITLPYLDPRVNPARVDFDPYNPECSKLLISDPLISLNTGTETMRFILYKVLGAGNFGVVELAQNADTGEWVALKRFKKRTSSKKFMREVNGLAAANTLIGVDETQQIMAMRLLPGCNLDFAVVNHYFDEEHAPQNVALLQRLVIAKEVLKRAAGIHKDVELIKNPALRNEAMRMLHLDIKPSNIMVDTATNAVMFCDYGFAKQLPPQFRMRDDEARTLGELELHAHGTSEFMAPEFFHHLRDKYKFNEATEVYALGMTLAEIMGITKYGKRVMPGVGEFDKLEIIRDTGNVPKAMVKLIKEMTHENPAKRPGVIAAAKRLNQIMFEEAKHSGLKVCTISIRAFLNADPKRREKFINEMFRNEINAVALTSLASEAVSLQEYYQVRYELMKAGIINVSPFMTIGPTQKHNIRVVKDYYDAMYATTHTQVFHYQQGKLMYKTTAATIDVLGETEKDAAVRETVDAAENKQIFAEIDYVLEESKGIAGWKKNDSVVLQSLPSFFSGKDFLPFMHALENAYLKSLKASKTLFGPKVTEDVINRAPDNKYVLSRTLGLMLKSIYEYVDDLQIPDVQRKAPGVMKIENMVERQKRHGAKARYTRI